jgi:sigma-B regulation protein RsbU (phosphoserine phosphatase)
VFIAGAAAGRFLVLRAEQIAVSTNFSCRLRIVKLRILIAEDDPVSCHVLTANLTKWGHEVVAVNNGLDAWLALQQDDAPNLVILDWMMPGMEGPEVCRHLRQSVREIETYVILLTARQGVAEVVKGIAAGADDYLTKPYHRDELRVRVQAGVRMIELQMKLADRVGQLQQALEQVKRLQGIIPICGYCKKIRDDQDYWQNVDSYIATHSEAEFSHGVCPACFANIVEPQMESFKALKTGASDKSDLELVEPVPHATT